MWKLGAGALLASAIWPGVAVGSISDVRLSERDCKDYDRERLSELLAIELETIRSELPSRPSDVFLECRDEVVSIRVALRDGSTARSADVDPRATARAARTRLLALTISELLAQLWSDSPPASASSSDPPSTTDDRARPLPSRTANRAIVAYAGAALRSMFEPRGALFGGTLGAEYQVSSMLALAFDVEGVYGTVQSEHATVKVLLGSAAFYSAVGPRFGRLTLGAGPGARLGWANLSPRSLEPNTVGSDVSGVWAGPLLLARAKWSNSGFVLYSRFETGVVTLPVVGTVNGNSPELELRGLWFALCAGTGANF